ncbi:hypothetical protein TRFO_12330 [Tritrichomonas foetus]|uniref:Uncharacterized protein n=1 Tax=Tritrichomonas foetus TaxID=1144522 RepID=A0A1J4J016_9EUKA|nr:hypothetical protein TRFO_12330 [Tritrichomonas foetus]|eukprot:OHS92770.1 hypothetical protein TRFO_12330 [Tritrichomonas foetus]
MKAMLIDALHMRAIQKCLGAITSENVGASVHSISSKKAKEVIHGISDATLYRPTQIPSLALTLKRYAELGSDLRIQAKLKSSILKYFFAQLEKGEIFPSKANIMHLILHMRLCGMISSADITSILSEKFKKRKYSNILFVWLFCLHALAISEVDPRFCSMYQRFCEDIIKKCFIPEPFKNFFDNINFFKENEWYNLKLVLMNQQPTDSIETALQRDDVDSLQQFSTLPTFKFDMLISPSIFACSPFIQNSPTMLEYASFFGSIQCFKFLWLNSSASILNRKETIESLTKYAIAGGNVQIVRFITSAGGNFRTSLPIAVQFHRNDLLAWIRENELGRLPEDHPFISHAIEIAAKYNNIHALSYFQERSSGVRPFEKAIHAASQSNSLESAKFLLSIQGIDYQTKDDVGMTPLHYAVANGSKDLVKLFLMFDNIDIYAKDDTGDTPISLASYNGRPDIQQLLKAAECKTTKKTAIQQRMLYNNDDN